MKYFLSSILLLTMSTSSFASENLSHWAYERYKEKDIEIISDQTIGQIDGNTYLALIVKKSEAGEMLLVVYDESISGKPSNIAIGELSTSPPFLYEVEIRKNSIFLNSSYCHNGCYDDRYQFKIIDGKFRLIGYESQVETASINFDTKKVLASCGVKPGDDIPDDCGTNVVSAGNSYNLLNSTSICWFDNSGNIPTNHKFSPRGAQHKVILKIIALPLMDGFNPEKTTLPQTCYFDYNKKLHLSETSPNK